MTFRAGDLFGGLSVAVVALVVAVVLLAISDGGDSAETTVLESPSPNAEESNDRNSPMVLGGKAYAEPYGKGWGEERPGAVSNGGASASTEMTDISWQTWGEAVAIGRGRLPLFKPDGGYYPEAAFVQVRASEIGHCEGKRAYLQFSFRAPDRPGGALGPWQSWAGSGNVCDPEFGPSAGGEAEPETSPEDEVLEDAALQGVDCGNLAEICIVTVKVSSDGEWAAVYRGPKPGHESEVQSDISSFKLSEGYWQAFQIGNGGGCDVPELVVDELGLDCF